MFDWILDYYNWRVALQYVPEFTRGMTATMWISLISLVLSLVVGTVAAIMRMSANPLLWRISAGYVQAIRSTPLLIQIYVIYFSLPALPILDRRLDEIEGGIIALGLNAGAYMSEIIRAGIESISKGQVEGAKSVGMTYLQRMRHVVLPQAFANVLPPLLGQTAVLIKDSSLVSFIGVFELFGAGLTVLSERLMPNEAFLTVAFLYLVIYGIMLFFSNYAQRKLGGGASMIEVIKLTMPFLLEGLWMTFKISLITIFCGSLLGFVVGMLRTVGGWPISMTLGIYIHALRGTPFLIHLYLIYFVLPMTGILWLQLEAFPAAVIALSLYTSTYVAEIVRGAVQAVPRGQSEAARSTGMTAWQSMRHVVLPQAVKMMIPPMGGIYVIIIKGTSIVSVIGIAELVRAGEHATQRHPRELMLIYGMTALMYFAYCYPVLRIARWAETKFGTVRLPS